MDEIEVKVKQETSLCAGCLSVNRRVTTLKTHSRLFISLLGQYAGLVSEDTVSLCWECSAVLRRIWKFQLQIQRAQVTLQQALNPEDENLQCLSTLCTTKFHVITCLPHTTETAILNSPPLQYDVPIVENIKVENTEIVGQKNDVIAEQGNDEVAGQGNDEIAGQKNDEIAGQENDEIAGQENDEHDETFEPFETFKEESQEESEESSENDSFPEVKDTEKPKKVGKKKKTCSSKPKKSKLKFSENLELIKNLEVDLDNCGKSFTDSTLTDEEATHGGIVRGSEQAKTTSKSCQMCRIPFLTRLDYRRHMTFCHFLKDDSKGPYNCLECFEQCPDKDRLRSHWNAHNKIMRCKWCKQAVDGSEGMLKHLKSHTRLYICTACTVLGRRVTFYAYRDFFYHCRDLHTKYLCDYCGTVRRSKQTMVNHMRESHDPEVLSRKEARELRYCVECDIEFRSVRAYRSHLLCSRLHNPKRSQHAKPRNCSNRNISDRNKIIALHGQGMNQSEIARELCMSRGTVRHWVRRYTKDGSLTDRPRQQPSWRRVSPEQVQQMIRHLEQFPDTSTKTFAQQYKCTARTIRTVLHKAGCGHFLKNPAQKKRKT